MNGVDSFRPLYREPVELSDGAKSSGAPVALSRRDDDDILALNAAERSELSPADLTEQIFTGALTEEIGADGLEFMEAIEELGLGDIAAKLPKTTRDEFNAILLEQLASGVTAVEAAATAIQQMLPRSEEFANSISEFAEFFDVEPEALVSQIENTDPALIAAQTERMFRLAA